VQAREELVYRPTIHNSVYPSSETMQIPNDDEVLEEMRREEVIVFVRALGCPPFVSGLVQDFRSRM
jgi:hypothetical protein